MSYLTTQVDFGKNQCESITLKSVLDRYLFLFCLILM